MRSAAESRAFTFTEHVKNGTPPYRASLTEDFTKKQALALDLLLIKAAQS